MKLTKLLPSNQQSRHSAAPTSSSLPTQSIVSFWLEVCVWVCLCVCTCQALDYPLYRQMSMYPICKCCVGSLVFYATKNPLQVNWSSTTQLGYQAYSRYVCIYHRILIVICCCCCFLCYIYVVTFAAYLKVNGRREQRETDSLNGVGSKERGGRSGAHCWGVSEPSSRVSTLAVSTIARGIRGHYLCIF